jgi:hypothetical protein
MALLIVLAALVAHVGLVVLAYVVGPKLGGWW